MPLVQQQIEDKDSWSSLVKWFDDLFFAEFNTRLVAGGAEPEYLPATTKQSCHQIIFAHGFFASALHEIAHWCVAGTQRRKLVDYGYWYEPDGRSAAQQAEFESVEVKPQALEWIMSVACGRTFRVSVDNLSGEQTNSANFKQALFAQVQRYVATGLPAHPATLVDALSGFYQTGNVLKPQLFLLEHLG